MMYIIQTNLPPHLIMRGFIQLKQSQIWHHVGGVRGRVGRSVQLSHHQRRIPIRVYSSVAIEVCRNTRDVEAT